MEHSLTLLSNVGVERDSELFSDFAVRRTRKRPSYDSFAPSQREGRGREPSAPGSRAGCVRRSATLPVVAVHVYDCEERRAVRAVRRLAVFGRPRADAGRPCARARAPAWARSPLRLSQPGEDRRGPAASRAGRASASAGYGGPTGAGRRRLAAAAANANTCSGRSICHTFGRAARASTRWRPAGRTRPLPPWRLAARHVRPCWTRSGWSPAPTLPQ